MKTVGLIVNPVAGLGGRAALKGSDGAASKAALAMGYEPLSSKRAALALSELPKDVTILTFSGEVGENAVREVGLSCEIIADLGSDTTGADTEKAAKLLAERSVDLILFAGGDGTARDICCAVDDKTVVLGIPAGVKIHSSVYAQTPKAAGRLAHKFLASSINTVLGEVMDIDEDAFREGKVSSRLYGAMRVPADRLVQPKKSGGYSDDNAILALTAAVESEIKDDTLCIFGPGSTTYLVMERLSLKGTLLGVDAVLNGEVIAKDIDEHKLWSLCEKAERIKLFVTPIGGQGMLFGRGNQQLSPRILRSIGRENIIVLASKQKLNSLSFRPLVVDTGDEELDSELSGYIRVTISKDESVIYKLEA